jgi:hypothetical protein
MVKQEVQTVKELRNILHSATNAFFIVADILPFTYFQSIMDTTALVPKESVHKNKIATSLIK